MNKMQWSITCCLVISIINAGVCLYSVSKYSDFVDSVKYGAYGRDYPIFSNYLDSAQDDVYTDTDDSSTDLEEPNTDAVPAK